MDAVKDQMVDAFVIRFCYLALWLFWHESNMVFAIRRLVSMRV